MAHLPALVTDLALILATAGIVTLIFKRIGQPVVLGYILAGFLIGPHFGLTPTVADTEGVRTWAEIGVIFLLFALGLEFSFRRLASVGAAASITAIIEVIAMVAVGYLTGLLFGWSSMDSIFLGGILAISSTTIIIRAFEETGVKGRGFVSFVFGVLIVEDLVAVLLLVLLSTVAVSRSFEGSELAISVLKLAFFLVLWFVAGIYFLPTIFRRARGFLGGETLLILSVGLCFLMVVIATQVGFSAALGAFIMGSLLAETTESERIEHAVAPVKDLFAAIFFVSVGMLIDPAMLREYAGPVAVITVVTIAGKALSTIAGALMAGRSLRHSVQSGLSLAQIGEFSFIIASLGQSLKVTSDFLYPVAVGVSAVTTFSTPYLIRSADRVYSFIEGRLPAALRQGIARYSDDTRMASASSEWRELLKAYFVRALTNTVVVIAVFLGCRIYLLPAMGGEPNKASPTALGVLVMALLASSPFLWAMAISVPQVWTTGEIFRSRSARGPLLAIELGRRLGAVVLVAALSTGFIPFAWGVVFAVSISTIVLLLFRKKLEKAYAKLETRFIGNLTAKGREAAATRTATPTLAPWDAHISRFRIDPASALVGKTLEELRIRERFGTTIALIERGDMRITAPGRKEVFYPYDWVSVIGTDEQILAFRPWTEAASTGDTRANASNYSLHPVLIGDDSPFRGRTIRESGIREAASGLVVGIERNGKKILNPDSLLTIELGDVLWIVGEKSQLRSL